MTSIGIAGFGTYFPQAVETAADLAPRAGIPEAVLREKMGIQQRHIAGADDSVTAMASRAARRALEMAGVPAQDVQVVISHGSEHKDHLVWNAAAKIAHNVGADNAYAFEVYALCAGAPIALNVARGLLLAYGGSFSPAAQRTLAELSDNRLVLCTTLPLAPTSDVPRQGALWQPVP